jgi:hypothetical protein
MPMGDGAARFGDEGKAAERSLYSAGGFAVSATIPSQFLTNKSLESAATSATLLLSDREPLDSARGSHALDTTPVRSPPMAIVQVPTSTTASGGATRQGRWRSCLFVGGFAVLTYEGAGRCLTSAASRRSDRPAMRDLAMLHRPA